MSVCVSIVSSQFQLAGGLRPHLLGLKLGWLGLTGWLWLAGWLNLRADWLRPRLGWLSLRPHWLRPGWLGLAVWAWGLAGWAWLAGPEAKLPVPWASLRGDVQMGRHTEVWTHIRTDERTDVQTYRWMYRRTYGKSLHSIRLRPSSGLLPKKKIKKNQC